VLSVRARPLRAGGEGIGAVAFVRDVTDVRLVDSMRRDFVANVSHELKTPIGALALLAETIAAGGDSDTMTQLSQRLVREADRLARIVDDLLDLSAIERQEDTTREQVPMSEMVTAAVDRVRSAAESREIELRLLDMTDATIECDPSQIVSAVANLLDNAIKYSDRGQSVEVACRVEGDRAVVEVRDHGIGIPPRDRERIFERFYRVDRARSRETGGTGLGLSIVRNVVQHHGGEVTVESVEGEGSTFRMMLRRARH
jgi:two-component system sensor histidine kinase SenX3